ncbi:MAG TPA: YicC/YloC family endoribonuclease, partial [Candidatus Acidoferrum sp.]|nr:YicC/YloC family endoribonuclease [Candidatus Acidoferrum sp.]
MNSMTGFGRAQLTTRFGRLTVEIASVNNRYLDISVRLPRQFASLELRVRELVSARVTRGNVTVNINLDGISDSTDQFSVNRTAAKAYVQQLRSLKKELKLEGDVTLHDLLMLPEVAGSESHPLDLDEVWSFFSKGLTKALAELAAMRAREGQAMQKDMHKRLQLLRKTITSIRKQTSNAVQVYRDKLAARIVELLEPSQRATLRIEEEVAIFAERTDITEECTRFISHI